MRASETLALRRLILLLFEHLLFGGAEWADADVAEAIDYCNYYAHEMLRLAEPQQRDVPGEENAYFYEPRGVTVIIAPWNFPLAILTGMSTAALVTGNTVVMKPAEQSSIIAAGLMDVFLEAGLPPEVRANLSAAFASRRAALVVATNAFGMGIDRPDVRVVVHAQLPASIDAYYQEVGRAGRDGLPATGLLLVSDADIALRRRMCMLGPDGAPAAAADAARAFSLFREVLRYADAAACRHDFILRYFGDDAESLEQLPEDLRPMVERMLSGGAPVTFDLQMPNMERLERRGFGDDLLNERLKEMERRMEELQRRLLNPNSENAEQETSDNAEEAEAN